MCFNVIKNAYGWFGRLLTHSIKNVYFQIHGIFLAELEANLVIIIITVMYRSGKKDRKTYLTKSFLIGSELSVFCSPPIRFPKIGQLKVDINFEDRVGKKR